MDECPKCGKQDWEVFDCDRCEIASIYIEPKFKEYKCHECDSVYQDYDDIDLFYHQECNKIMNGLFCVHGCDNGHVELVGPVIPLASGEVPGGQGKGILFDCPSCNIISVPANPYNWEFRYKEDYDYFKREFQDNRVSYQRMNPNECKGPHRSNSSLYYSRCGFCGCPVGGHFDNLVSPFSVILSCSGINSHEHHFLSPGNTWIDCIEGNRLNQNAYQEIGVANNLRYYSTECICGDTLFFVSDMDLLQDHLIWNEEEDFLFDSDYVYVADVDEWIQWHDLNDLTYDPNFRRSTHFVNKIPKHLCQVYELPNFDQESDFNKSDFNKGM